MKSEHRQWNMDKKLVIVAVALALFVVCFATSNNSQAQATADEAEIAGLLRMTDAELQRRARIEYMRAITKDNNARLEHRIAMMQHDQSLFAWQRRASEVLLWVVVAVVGCGLLFAGYQLVVVMESARRQSFRAINEGEATAQGANSVPPTTMMMLGLNKLEVTSSVVGITVLVISIAFLYLFVREVYTIHQPMNENIAPNEVPAEEPAGSDSP
jgi:hypothetical protein